MLRKSPDFSETDLGFPSFARFLEAARDEGVVRINRDRKSGGYRVDSADSPDHGDDEADDERSEASVPWVDEYLPDEAKRFVEALEKSKLYPFAAPTRLAVLEALEQVVEERRKRRRKTTLKYVTEDIQKKLRRTHPDMPVRLLKGLLEGLLYARELIHRDGTAIRSHTAAFTLNKDAAGLNQALVKLFLGRLKAAEVDLDNTKLLAELMFGDAERTKEIEETLAYLEMHADEVEPELELEPSSNGAAGPLDDLDMLLVETDQQEHELDDLDAALTPSEEPAVEAAPPEVEDNDDVEAQAEPEPEPKPKRRTRRKKAEPAEPAETDAPAEVAADPEEVPAKPRARRRKKPEPNPEPEEA